VLTTLLLQVEALVEAFQVPLDLLVEVLEEY
jgi:hypothetical protein